MITTVIIGWKSNVRSVVCGIISAQIIYRHLFVAIDDGESEVRILETRQANINVVEDSRLGQSKNLHQWIMVMIAVKTIDVMRSDRSVIETTTTIDARYGSHYL